MTTKVCKKCNFIFDASIRSCPECKRIYNRQYREKNRDKLNQYIRNWRLENPEKWKESDRRWKENNQERARKNNSDWSKRNKDKKNKSAAEYKQRNPEKVKNKNRRHYELNKEDYFIRSVNRRFALKAGGVLSKNIKQKLYELQKGLCVCCKQPLEDDYHLDHIIPLYLGGKNIDSNVQLLRAECNLKKGKIDPIDYMQSKGFLI